MSASKEYVFPDRAISSSKRGQYIHLAIMIIAVLGISVAALFYSLGYKLNLQTGSIEQTGLINLALRTGGTDARVIINNELVADTLPFRSRPLPPGTYTVEINKAGFKSWSRILTVTANRVENFRAIILIKEKPTPLTVTEDMRQALAQVVPDVKGIQVQENELWIDGTFITRTSKDIVAARWYTDRDHVVYQLGKTLWIAASDGLHSQELVAVSQEGAIPFAYWQGGQVLVYQDGKTVKAVGLY